MDIEQIKQLCKNKKLRWTNHIFLRLVQRNISIDDVLSAIENGVIIEEYPDDYPHPSCLIVGKSKSQNVLHVVCGSNDAELWLITAYKPNAEKWTSDFTERKL